MTDPDPSDLADWGLHCYCPNARRTPHQLVIAHGRTLYAARTGIRRADLGITDEQLAELARMRLITVEDDWLTTAFPTLGSLETTGLRSVVAAAGRELSARMAGQVATLEAELQRRGHPRHLYAAVLGYALDLVLWTHLRARCCVPDTALSEDRPYWNGLFWAIHPPRPGSSGTNFYRMNRHRKLVAVWSSSTESALHDLAVTPGLSDVVARPGAHAVRDSSGRLRHLGEIPVFGTGDTLDAIAEAIAAPVADYLACPAADPAREHVPGGDPRAGTVVVAHELMWEIAERVVPAGPPPGDDLTPLLYLLHDDDTSEPTMQSAPPEPDVDSCATVRK